MTSEHKDYRDYDSESDSGDEMYGPEDMLDELDEKELDEYEYSEGEEDLEGGDMYGRALPVGGELLGGLPVGGVIRHRPKRSREHKGKRACLGPTYRYYVRGKTGPYCKKVPKNLKYSKSMRYPGHRIPGMKRRVGTRSGSNSWLNYLSAVRRAAPCKVMPSDLKTVSNARKNGLTPSQAASELCITIGSGLAGGRARYVHRRCPKGKHRTCR